MLLVRKSSVSGDQGSLLLWPYFGTRMGQTLESLTSVTLWHPFQNDIDDIPLNMRGARNSHCISRICVGPGLMESAEYREMRKVVPSQEDDGAGLDVSRHEND